MPARRGAEPARAGLRETLPRVDGPRHVRRVRERPPVAAQRRRAGNRRELAHRHALPPLRERDGHCRIGDVLLADDELVVPRLRERMIERRAVARHVGQQRHLAERLQLIARLAGGQREVAGDAGMPPDEQLRRLAIARRPQLEFGIVEFIGCEVARAELDPDLERQPFVRDPAEAIRPSGIEHAIGRGAVLNSPVAVRLRLVEARVRAVRGAAGAGVVADRDAALVVRLHDDLGRFARVVDLRRGVARAEDHLLAALLLRPVGLHEPRVDERLVEPLPPLHVELAVLAEAQRQVGREFAAPVAGRVVRRLRRHVEAHRSAPGCLDRRVDDRARRRSAHVLHVLPVAVLHAELRGGIEIEPAHDPRRGLARVEVALPRRRRRRACAGCRNRNGFRRRSGVAPVVGHRERYRIASGHRKAMGDRRTGLGVPVAEVPAVRDHGRADGGRHAGAEGKHVRCELRGDDADGDRRWRDGTASARSVGTEGDAVRAVAFGDAALRDH